MSNSFEIFAEHRFWSRNIGLHLFDRQNGTYAADLKWEPYENGTITSPFLAINPHEAQSLMDQLWKCGLRPTEGAGSAGALAATERHLSDLQRLVFKDYK